MKKGKKQKLYTNQPKMNDETLKVVKVLFAVILVIGIVYLVTAIINGEINLNKDTEEETAETEIQYEEILAGQTFNRKEAEYYVLLYNFTSDNATLLTTLKDNYEALNLLPVYIVDLDKGFNTSYIAKEDETIIEKPKTIDDFQVKEATLVKIKNGKVTERIASEESIKTILKSLTD